MRHSLKRGTYYVLRRKVPVVCGVTPQTPHGPPDSTFPQDRLNGEYKLHPGSFRQVSILGLQAHVSFSFHDSPFFSFMILRFPENSGCSRMTLHPCRSSPFPLFRWATPMNVRREYRVGTTCPLFAHAQNAANGPNSKVYTVLHCADL
jgi:hypothetical protein